MKPIDNIFNYVPTTIRREMNDDDLIMSWALQAFRELNFQGYQYERAIEFSEISGYQADMPEDFLLRHKVSVFCGLSSSSSVASLFECEDCEEDREEQRDNPCPLTHRLVLASSFYRENGWQTMRYTPNIGKDFFCKTTIDACQPLWSVKNQKIFTSAKEGLLAVEYFRYARDDKDRILIPEGPEILWSYLSYHVQRRYLEDKRYQVSVTNINEARSLNAANTMHQQVMTQEKAFQVQLRAQIMLSNMRMENIQSIQSGGIMRTAHLLRRHLTTYYAV